MQVLDHQTNTDSRDNTRNQQKNNKCTYGMRYDALHEVDDLFGIDILHNAILLVCGAYTTKPMYDVNEL